MMTPGPDQRDRRGRAPAAAAADERLGAALVATPNATRTRLTFPDSTP